jgi:hypothetical protein
MIATILMHTPPWVWVVLAVLVVLGLSQARARPVPGARITVLPVVVMVLSLLGVVRGFEQPVLALGAWLAAFAGVTLGARDRLAVRGAYPDARQGRLVLPGSYVPLMVVLTLFVTKYVSAVAVAMHPTLSGDATFVAAASAAYGACAGALYARARSLRPLVRALASRTRPGQPASGAESAL